ncbi:MAG: hypothetical protein IJP04_02590 [Clostridia bacterium]|nr:hypothetical protein [Clostridia bacterium]
MLNAQKIKEIALAYGADEVGIASMDRFEGAPPQMDPRKWMPRAKSMIVFGYRIFRGALRGVEEGTNFGTYSTMCYGYINQRMIPWTARQVARVLEDEGYEAMPVGYHVYGGAINTNDGKSWKNNETGYSVPVEPGMPRPDVYFNIRIAAYLAGLGEIGWSKMFLSRKFGPRIRLAVLLTDMELEPDPIIPPGTLCNKCMACARACPSHSISTTKSIKVKLGGYDVEWGEIDEPACNKAFVGSELCEEGEEGNYFKAGPNVGKYRASSISPFYQKPDNQYGTGQAICGAQGCIRACMMSMEARGVLENKFDSKFRRRPKWSVDWAPVREKDKLEDQENKAEE